MIGFKLNDEQYYYIRNGQNDIIGILDNNLNQVANYTYDTWGKLISIKDGEGNDVTNNANHIGYKNPYRYREYRYDTETGLYYLQSRYYDPEMGRFINADGYLQTGEGLLDKNMYAYCQNNPVMCIDVKGEAITIIGGIILGILGILGSVVIANVPQDTWNTAGESFSSFIDSIAYSKSSTKNPSKKNTNVSKQDTSNSKKKNKIQKRTVVRGDHQYLPKESDPNSVWEWFTAEGRLKRRRFFGPDGRAIKDIDYRHQDDGTHEFPHEHKWEWDDGKPKRLE